MLQPVAMTCDVASPWGDIRFEALTSAVGYQVQLSRDGQVLASDWVANGNDLMARWHKVREGLYAAGAGTSQPQSHGGGLSGGPCWGPCAQMPTSVALSLQR